MNTSVLTNGLRPALLLLCLAGVPLMPAAAAEPDAEASVVKVFSTVSLPEPSRPWTRQAPREISGSGVVIDGDHILTNAHVVSYASQVQIQGSQSGDKLTARVEAFAPGIDLALLKVDDASFFHDHPALKRAAKLPEIRDNVLVYGFPTGGTALSITKGIVSRIEFTGYNYPTAGLRIQIDAALNPGNSGGPALVDDQMIGLAFSALNNAQNIGYIIPTEEIELFLKDVADGHYDGKPALYDDLQTLENPALRSYLKIPDTAHGILVRSPYAGVTANPLHEWDLITRVGDVPVDDQGMVTIGSGLRVRFRYLAQQLAVGGKLPLTVVRGGKEMKIDMPLVNDRPLLIPELAGTYPPYFIYGPIVFSKATTALVAGLTGNAAAMDVLTRAGNPILTRRAEAPTPAQQELVVIVSPFFPHPLMKGYGSAAGAVVDSVNGVPVRSLKHFVELLRDQSGEFIVLRLSKGIAETLVLPRAEMLKATEDVLRDNGIRDQGSAELMAVWQQHK